jgi:tetratricopeptide (TPR) repeat protein
LSRIVRDQGRDDEALVYSKAAEVATGEDDLESQALWRMVRAPILARAGDEVQAELLARAAVDLTRRTEAPLLQADALAELAAVLRIGGKRSEAREAIAQAVALYASKGDVVSAARARAWADAVDQRTM